jgi:hypothetical protein
MLGIISLDTTNCQIVVLGKSKNIRCSNTQNKKNKTLFFNHMIVILSCFFSACTYLSIE